MKILVTGYNGFVARDTVIRLAETHQLIGVGRTFKHGLADQYIQTDIRNKDKFFKDVLSVTGQVDAVVHFAALLGGNDRDLYETNCLGTQNVVELAKKLKSRHFIYLSSVPIIGYPSTLPVTEEHSIFPRTTYHLTKYLGEQIVHLLNNSGMSYKIFRIASPVGYGMPQDKIFSVFVNNAADGKELKVYGNGKRIQNYIDTRDVARAVECGLLVDHLNGVYLISGNSIGDLELARECVAFFNRGASIIVDGNKIDSDYERWDLSGKKAEKELGYISIKSIFDSMEYVRGKQ